MIKCPSKEVRPRGPARMLDAGLTAEQGRCNKIHGRPGLDEAELEGKKSEHAKMIDELLSGLSQNGNIVKPMLYIKT